MTEVTCGEPAASHPAKRTNSSRPGAGPTEESASDWEAVNVTRKLREPPDGLFTKPGWIWLPADTSEKPEYVKVRINDFSVLGH